jgi:phosphoglycolate phosphatase
MTSPLFLFDLDGTLLDSADMILMAQKRAFAALGLEPPPRKTGLSIVGLSLTEAFRVLAGPEGPIDALTEAYRRAFFELRASDPHLESLFPGAGALIESLRKAGQATLGIATGKSRRGVEAILAKYHWNGHFSVTQSSDDAPSKPHPGMVLNACRITGSAPENTFMIGDSSFDMEMARRAGARAVGVAWGFQPVDMLIAAGAEHIVEDFDALAALLQAFTPEALSPAGFSRSGALR